VRRGGEGCETAAWLPSYYFICLVSNKPLVGAWHMNLIQSYTECVSSAYNFLVLLLFTSRLPVFESGICV